MNCPVPLNTEFLQMEADFWADFTARLHWTVRYKSILVKQSVPESMLEASRIFYEMRGRRPHYGAEIYRFVAEARRVLAACDRWIPDPLEIWQETEYHESLKPIYDDMTLVIRTSEIDAKLTREAKELEDRWQEMGNNPTDEDSEGCEACGA